MVHQIVHCRFHPEVNEQRVEWIMRQTRMRLLKIPEIRAMGCGKAIDPESPWRFYFSADYESMEKMKLAQADPTYEGFVGEVIAPFIAEHLSISYEMDPDRDVKYS